MRFSKNTADVFVPDSSDAAAALARTTHLCVGAHQDDVEILAFHGIAECFGRDDRWFSSVVLTDGGGSPRAGVYKEFTDEMMKSVRKVEQRKAAVVGDYSIQVQLAYSSYEVKAAVNPALSADLQAVFEAAAPEVVYLHNPADKHDTHVSAFLRCIDALRRLPESKQPRQVFGCEVWRSLDWMDDADKVVLPTDRYPNISSALVAVFESQIGGGKRYDLATAGRRLANATYLSSHSTDDHPSVSFAMDLTPLLRDKSMSPWTLVESHVNKLSSDVKSRLEKFQ